MYVLMLKDSNAQSLAQQLIWQCIPFCIRYIKTHDPKDVVFMSNDVRFKIFTDNFIETLK